MRLRCRISLLLLTFEMLPSGRYGHRRAMVLSAPALPTVPRVMHAARSARHTLQRNTARSSYRQRSGRLRTVARQPLLPTSFWNEPLSANAALAPDSHAYVDELTPAGSRIRTAASTPRRTASRCTWFRYEPTRHVTLDTWGPDLQQAFDEVPIPPDAKAAAGTDAEHDHRQVRPPPTGCGISG